MSSEERSREYWEDRLFGRPEDVDWFFAWQFIRRNPDYWKDWDQTLEACPDYEEKWKRAFASEDPNPEDLAIDAARTIAKWGFYPLIDPSHQMVLRPHTVIGRTGRLHGGAVAHLDDLVRLAHEDYNDLSEVETSLVGVIDLLREIKPQLESIELIARGRQRYLKSQGLEIDRTKRHVRLWGFYLYVLDAVDQQGLSIKEIADSFDYDPMNTDSPVDEKKVWDRLQAARRLSRPEGYLRDILGLE